MRIQGFPGGSEVKGSACNAGEPGLIAGLGRWSPGEGNGNPPQYSCLGNPMDRGAWWPTVHGVTKSWTLLSDFTFTFTKWGYSVRVLVAQLCLTLCDPMDYSPSGSSVHKIFQTRILEGAAISFSRGCSWPRDWTRISCSAVRFFTIWATSEAQGNNSSPSSQWY